MFKNNKKHDSNYKWKIVSITLIIVFILEHLFFIWAYFSSEQDLKEEALCRTQFCPVDKFTAYGYDIDTNICTCFKGNEVVEQHVIE